MCSIDGRTLSAVRRVRLALRVVARYVFVEAHRSLGIVSPHMHMSMSMCVRCARCALRRASVGLRGRRVRGVKRDEEQTQEQMRDARIREARCARGAD